MAIGGLRPLTPRFEPLIGPTTIPPNDAGNEPCHKWRATSPVNAQA